MRSSARLQLLTCLMLYASCVQGIMVKFGTKGGPIEPPVPEPTLPPPRPYRAPAPVWEERSNDAPDPNAHWRPQPFKPQPRYTHVIYNAPAPSLPLNNAQRFVNAYIPRHEPVHAKPVQNYFTPAQVLGSQTLPGVGLRYFVPVYVNESPNRVETKKEDSVHNNIESNDVDGGSRDSASDLQWKYEKDASKRNVRNTLEGTPVYQWPAYVPRQH
ncbi:uncharacterized protein LOC115451616 [Manduca sexta]|uniref:Uncharacterized protein n=1 Tax=Manduca sexta TaxID=7130 RepID=A0A921ZR03_MANSE|nr:uncharacterized protein LOC115451616 [Manduca sexta]XP_037299374.1 uncharacterized protein LOC115451616 [Manduca sexta]KAG6462389.1 hypothetical protein O3G_MSEX013230 [Manduca sexta]KAG6462390.1 hypothetical protein O3G_MSEX013230 [Manduca sexta]KAG6462391.1 hypothetical protein O3G_MSEX013230 [Manduca sexta]